MCKFDSSLTLRKLLDHCSDPSDSCYECGWSNFYDRFNDFIYSQVKHSCYRWNAKRLNLQFSEAIDDCVQEVYKTLTKNLISFKSRDDKGKFHAYLKVICRNTCLLFLGKFFKPLWDADELDSLIVYIQGLDTDCSWEYYEIIVTISRESSTRENLERDLNVFNLIVFERFSKPMLKSHQCFSKMSDTNIENSVFRIREILRENVERF